MPGHEGNQEKNDEAKIRARTVKLTSEERKEKVVPTGHKKKKEEK